MLRGTILLLMIVLLPQSAQIDIKDAQICSISAWDVFNCPFLCLVSPCYYRTLLETATGKHAQDMGIRPHSWIAFSCYDPRTSSTLPRLTSPTWNCSFTFTKIPTGHPCGNGGNTFHHPFEEKKMSVTKLTSIP